MMINLKNKLKKIQKIVEHIRVSFLFQIMITFNTLKIEKGTQYLKRATILHKNFSNAKFLTAPNFHKNSKNRPAAVTQKK